MVMLMKRLLVPLATPHDFRLPRPFSSEVNAWRELKSLMKGCWLIKLEWLTEYSLHLSDDLLVWNGSP